MICIIGSRKFYPTTTRCCTIRLPEKCPSSTWTRSSQYHGNNCQQTGGT